MSTDRVFREEDAIWWDANVKGPRRYSFREMNEEYKGLSPFSSDTPSTRSPDVKHVYVVDPNASIRVDIDWMNIIALVIIMLAVVAVAAIFAAAIVFVVAAVAVVLGTVVLLFRR